MIVENAFTVTAPMDQVFDALRDVRTVLPCLDARVTEVVDGHTARGELTLPMGEATAVLQGTLWVGDADRDAGAITYEAQGRGSSASAQGRLTVRLRESDGQTTVSVHADLDVDGGAGHAVNGEHQELAHTLLARLGHEVSERVRTGESRIVRGTVRMVVESPVPRPAEEPGNLLRRHPWVVPALLVGGTVAVLLIRRRRRSFR